MIDTSPTRAAFPRRPRVPVRAGALAAALALAVGLGGCGLAAGSSGPATTADSSGPSSPAAWPRTVTDCGQSVTIPKRPERIVGIEGGAETVLALGAGDRMAGWFGSKVDQLPEPLAEQARKSTFLGGSFPTPTIDAVLKSEPDLVVLYGYSKDAGLTKARFDELGVPSLVLSESCDSDADSTMEGYFRDVAMVATAIGDEAAGDSLVAGWRTKIADATSTPVQDPPSILVNGNPDPRKPFVSAGRSLANDQIKLAGGTNAFGDVSKAFIEPSWEEVATRDPEIIVDGSGGMAKSTAALRAYLRKDAALSDMQAVRDDAFLTISYYDNVPGPRAVDGVIELAQFLRR